MYPGASEKDDRKARQERAGFTHRYERGRTEASAAVKPVIITELVDLDTFLIGRLMRHRVCHHHGFGVPLGDNPAVAEEIRREI